LLGARLTKQSRKSMAISKGEYQAALSAFPAGVTIVTSRSAAGDAVGATVSAFMALSLEPPLILVSLKSDSRTAAAIAAHRAFVVHFVNEATASLARIFASSAGDKFSGLRAGANRCNVPTLLDCDIRLSCSLHAQHGGGDHLMFVGHVDEAHLPDAPGQSVAWYGRQFCQLVALAEKA
jgi:flavin reductase (DIM6/NTAB) family NADH-FMN oxidoreductase RutF